MSKLKSFLIPMLAFTALVIAGGSCTQKAGFNEADLQGYAITTSGSTQAFEQACFAITNSTTLLSANWTVQDSLSGPVSNYLGCGPSNQLQLCCTFQSTGPRTVAVTAATRGGATVSLNTSVNITASAGGVPALVIDVETTGNSTPLGTYSQDPANIPSVPIPSLVPAQTYTFDFHRSESNVSAQQDPTLTYQISFGTGYAPVNGSSTTQSFPTSNIYPVTVSATNSLGNTTVATFQVFVQCTDAANHAFTLNAAAVQVTAGSDINYFSYDITGIRVGGLGTDAQFNYMIDLNGDGIFDTAWTPLTQPSQANKYVLYVSSNTQYPTRPISVLVWDTQCNIVESVSVPKTLAASAAPSAGSPTFPGGLAGHDFIQGDVDWLPAPPSNPIDGVNLSYLGTRPSGASSVNLVCNYTGRGGMAPDGNPAVMGGNMSFVITSQVVYPDSAGNNKVPEQMQLNIAGIQDLTGEQGNSNPIDTSHAIVTSLTYQTDYEGDIQPQFGFANDQPCTLSHVAVNTTGAPVCNGSDASTQLPGYTASIQGDFFCPHLSNTQPANAIASVKIGDRGTGTFSLPGPGAGPLPRGSRLRERDLGRHGRSVLYRRELRLRLYGRLGLLLQCAAGCALDEQLLERQRKWKRERKR